MSIMPFFVFFIVVSAIAYVYFKVRYVRTKKAVEREYYSAKSSMSLGLFIMFFGANQLILNRGTLAVVIGVIFMLTGLGSMWAGYKAYKHYVPLLAKKTNGRTHKRKEGHRPRPLASFHQLNHHHRFAD